MRKDITEIKDFDEFKQSEKALFVNHKALLTKLKGNNGKDCVISFRQDDTVVGKMQITYIDGVIAIHGDYGSAIFNWHNSSNHILAYVGMESFEYVLEKLEASKDVWAWDSDLFQKDFSEWKEQLIEEGHKKEDIEGLEPYIDDKHEVAEYFRNLNLIESYEAYEYGCFSFGKHISWRTYAIWYGFQEAVKQLDERGEF